MSPLGRRVAGSQRSCTRDSTSSARSLFERSPGTRRDASSSRRSTRAEGVRRASRRGATPGGRLGRVRREQHPRRDRERPEGRPHVGDASGPRRPYEPEARPGVLRPTSGRLRGGAGGLSVLRRLRRRARCRAAHRARICRRPELAGVFGWEFFVPEDAALSDEDLLEEAAVLARKKSFRAARTDFHEWRRELLAHGRDARTALADMERKIDRYRTESSKARTKSLALNALRWRAARRASPRASSSRRSASRAGSSHSPASARTSFRREHR